MFVAKFPVTVRFEAVVDAIVELPLTFKLVKRPVAKARIFPRIFVTVVEARVEDPVTFKFVLLETVVVEFVNVALVAVKLVGFKVAIERLVIVALVIVAFVAIKFENTADKAVNNEVNKLVEVEFVNVPFTETTTV